MTEDAEVAGPIRPFSRVDSLKYRERQDRARAERRAQAAAEAAELYQAAKAKSDAERPLWVCAVILLMQAVRGDCAMVTVVRGNEGRRCRITQGRSGDVRPSRRWPGPQRESSAAGLTPIQVQIEALQPETTPAPMSSHLVPGATSSFHAPLYLVGSNQPMGCLSLYSRRNLSLTADRVAFIDAVAVVLARDLASTPLPTPPDSR